MKTTVLEILALSFVVCLMVFALKIKRYQEPRFAGEETVDLRHALGMGVAISPIGTFDDSPAVENTLAMQNRLIVFRTQDGGSCKTRDGAA